MWWILPFNECSQHQSQFTNPNTFQRLNATVTGTEKCFQYRNCVNNSLNYIAKYLYFFLSLSSCNFVLKFSLDYDLFEIQIFCNLHPGSVIPDTWQDLVREEMMPPLQCTILFTVYYYYCFRGLFHMNLLMRNEIQYMYQIQKFIFVKNKNILDNSSDKELMRSTCLCSKKLSLALFCSSVSQQLVTQQSFS